MKETRGGKREGAGRPSKVDEKKANAIMLTALSELHKTSSDDKTKIAFAKDLLEFERGKMFIAEHVFGKPKDVVENTHNVNNFDIKDIFKFDKDKD